MKKRFWKGLLILLAVLLVLYLAVQGYIAMETKKRADAPGNAAEYDVDQLQAREATALNGKTILFLGSSVTEGAAAERQSFVELFAALDGVSVIKEAKSGTTLADKTSLPALLFFGNGDSYVKRLKQIDPDTQIDCVVVQLSTNDATMKLPLGEIGDGDTKTVTGAMPARITTATRMPPWSSGCMSCATSGASASSTSILTKTLTQSTVILTTFICTIPSTRQRPAILNGGSRKWKRI